MDDHAKKVAARWAKKRAAAIEAGMRPVKFDLYMYDIMRTYGWSDETALAIVARARRLHEKEVSECEQS